MDYREMLGLAPKVSGREQPGIYRDVDGEFEAINRGLLDLLTVGGISKIPASAKSFGVFKDKTNMPHYDEMLNQPHKAEYFAKEKGRTHNVVEMTPAEYMYQSMLTRESRGTKHHQGLLGEKSRLNMNRVGEYQKKMQDGTKFDMPVLDFQKMSQEGAHRALAARQMGVEKIPVMVVQPAK
tara:strand:- start:42 stop:584 length:543 start_codon:yes stop_codon:yes gene_type:complete